MTRIWVQTYAITDYFIEYLLIVKNHSVYHPTADDQKIKKNDLPFMNREKIIYCVSEL